MRLTKYEPRESNIPYRLKDDELRTRLDVVHKLGRLEDIEEELGIDLVTLFKALKDGVYVKETQYSRHTDYIDGASLGFGHNGFYYYDAISKLWNIFFKDYGKTWALTKEELE